MHPRIHTTLHHVPQLLNLGRAIEVSLSEDPDLAVLEDDAEDLYAQTVTGTISSSAAAGSGGGRSNGNRFGGYRGGSGSRDKSSRDDDERPSKKQQQQQQRALEPLRAVVCRQSNLPWFSGAGLVAYPPPSLTAPLRQSVDVVAGPLAPTGGREMLRAAAAAGTRTPAPDGDGSDDDDDDVDGDKDHRPGAFSTATATTTTARESFPKLSDLDIFDALPPPPPPAPVPSSMDAAVERASRDHRSSPGRTAGNVAGGGGRGGALFSASGGGEGRRRGSSQGRPEPGMLLAVGGGGDRVLPAAAAAGKGSEGGFGALMEAFGRRGRADRGVEELRRREGPSGGGHELAALDDMHACLQAQGREGDGEEEEEEEEAGFGCEEAAREDGGRRARARARGQAGATELRYRSGGGRRGGMEDARRGWGLSPLFGVEEMGIRTSMSKGNRWVIGKKTGPRPRVGLVREGGGSPENGTLGGDSDNDSYATAAVNASFPGVIGSGGMSSCEGDDSGETYAIVEAPILSVGDARAAANRVLLSTADGEGGGESGAAAEGDGKGESGGGGSRRYNAGRRRRLFLR